jgi:hypothetical protein
MIRFYSSLFILLLSIFCAQAQTRVVSECGTDAMMQKQLLEQPDYQKQLDINEAFTRQYIARQRQARTAATLYTIPVVFHVIHTGGAVGTVNNPTDAAIQQALTDINDRFRKALVATLGGADIELQFALATRAPDCSPTTGILRVDGSVVPGYVENGIKSPGVDEKIIKNLSRWSNKDYINIWLVHKVEGKTNGPNYAYFPGASADVDGIVTTALVFNNRAGNTSILAHEMGHTFNLEHTFNGDNEGTVCPPNANCLTDGDKVCDTEPHIRNQCVTVPTINACTGINYVIADAAFNYTVLNNYMNYASAACTNMFSMGQKDRIRAALDGPRASLKNGNGFMANALNNLSGNITASSTWFGNNNYSDCANKGITLAAGSSAFATYQWQKDGADIPGATGSSYLATVTGAYGLVQTVCGASATTSNSISAILYPAPPAATISAPATRICTGSTLTLTATTDNFSYADRRQWHKDGQVIAGATGSTYGATTAGTYKLTVTRCGSTLTSADYVLTAVAAPTVACVPTFTNPAGNFYGLTNLTLDAINASSSTSGGDRATYVDRSCTHFGNVVAGARVPFSVKTFNRGLVKLFLDKNNNGTFVELASLATTAGSVDLAGSIDVPADATLNTPLRLRVGTTSTGYGTAAIVTACGLNEPVNANGSGQIEDFSLIVSGALPVELVSFSARSNVNRTVSIAWATATETDNHLFRVERSRDLLRFDTLATVPGRGTTYSRTEYAQTDEQPYPGLSYYRLVQTDFDGTQRAYKPISVFVEGETARLLAWPNPTLNKSFVIRQFGLRDAQISVLDMLGRSVEFGREMLTDDQIQINIGYRKPAGVYTVQVRQGLNEQSIRVVLE